MKISYCTLLSIFLPCLAQAQQVTKIDCCIDMGKAAIIINDNNSNTSTSITSLVNTTTVNGGFEFKLDIAANTSAGVYNTNDVLIRTLWSSVRYEAGCYSGKWDGYLDDDATIAPLGTYMVKILTNNVNYTWEIFGNTTNKGHVLKNYGGISSVASAGGKVFFGNGFYEGEPTSRFFSTTAIQDVNYVDVGVGVINTGVATDGTNNYWLGSDQYQNAGTAGNATNYIYVTKVSDNSEVVLSAATQHPSGRPGTQKMVVGWYADVTVKQYSAIAATYGNGGFIFATRYSENALYVFNKTTGSLLQTISIPSPTFISASGSKIWVTSNNSLLLYDVNSSTGQLSPTGTSISGLSIHSLAVNSGGTLLKIADDNTRTIKTYNGQTGAFISSFGRANGYNGNPNVTNDAFSFYRYPTRNEGEFANPCISFADDGSYWFNDPGNNRLMHFSSTNAYVEQISYIPSFRSINADPNNPTRVFIDELEYAIDYSKPLDNGTNGSWKLFKNWKENTVTDPYRKFEQIVTFPNGKTYAKSSLNNRLYWFSDNGAVDVGAVPDACILQNDGSIYQRVNNNNNNLIIYKAALSGYSGNMPTWGNFSLVVITPVYTKNAPYFFYNAENVRGSSTNTRREFFFNPWYGDAGGFDVGLGYHLGAIKAGVSGWDWQTAKSTFYDYQGDYPRDGRFDIGNSQGFARHHSENCQLLVQGSDLFWNVNAEFYATLKGGSGVNIWNHFNEDGLLVGNFGVTASEAQRTGEIQMAGNSYSTALVKVGADYYIYHCDENRWSSGHRWKVSGLSTIKEVSIPVTVSASINVIPDPNRVITNLPQRSTTFSGNASTIVDTAPDGYRMKTSTNNDDFTDPDILVGGSGTIITRIPLKNTITLPKWTLSGIIGKPNSSPEIPGNSNYNFFEVIDVAGKIIASYRDFADTRNYYYRYLYLNNTTFAEGLDANYTRLVNDFFKFSLSYQTGALTFKLGNFPAVNVTTPYETGADLSKPAFIRIRQAGNQEHYISLYNVIFLPNTLL